MVLFDTDTISNLLKRQPSPYLVARLQSAPPEQFTTSITVSELVYGAHRMSERTDELLSRIARLIASLTVLPFDVSAAHAYGRLRATLERSGTPLAEADLRIAAITLDRDLTLVTANLRHFGRVPGLRVENWLIASTNG